MVNDIETGKIYNEDCMETMERMDDNEVGIVVTSPPYNIGENRRNSDERSHDYDEYNDNLERERYFNKVEKWINKLIETSQHHVFFNFQEVSGNRGIVKFLRNKFSNKLKEVFVWAKTNPQAAIQDNVVGSGFEYIYCFSNDDPNNRKFNYCNFSNRGESCDYVNNVLRKPVGSGYEGHGYTFDEWLPEFFISNFSKEGDVVYDPFMGSGTTGLVAEKLNRNWIGSEISKDYCEMAEKRIKRERDQMKAF